MLTREHQPGNGAPVTGVTPGHFYLARPIKQDMPDQSPLSLALEYSEALSENSVAADQQQRECGNHLATPRVVLVVGVDTEHVYMMVASSWPWILQDYIPILPTLAREMQPDPVSLIPSNGLPSPVYLNFTHIIRGYLGIHDNGKWSRAPAPGPGVTCGQPGSDNTPLPPISLSAKDISYLHQCHRNFWAGLPYEKRAEQWNHSGDNGNGSLPGSGSFAGAAHSGGDVAIGEPGSEVSTASAGHEGTEGVKYKLVRGWNLGRPTSGRPSGQAQYVILSPTLTDQMLSEMELAPWDDEDYDEEPGCYEFVQIPAPPVPNVTAAEPPPDDCDEQEAWDTEEMYVVNSITGFNTPTSRSPSPLCGFCSTISGGGLPQLLPLSDGRDVN